MGLSGSSQGFICGALGLACEYIHNTFLFTIECKSNSWTLRLFATPHARSFTNELKHKWQYAPPHKNAPHWLTRAAAVLRRKIF